MRISQMKKFTRLPAILTISLFLLYYLNAFTYACGEDETEDSHFIGMGSDSHHIKGRILSEWESIRVKADFSNLWNLSQPHSDYLQHVVMPAAIEYIQNLYKVVRYTRPLMTPANETVCNGLAIPSELSAVGIPDTDLYILVSWVDSPNSSFVAKGGWCARDATTSRPYLGSIKFNYPKLALSEVKWKTTISVTLHEIHHILYFSASLFPHFIDPSTLERKYVSGYIKIDGIQTLVFIDPLIVKAAQEYFNCTKMKYVRLENQGGNGNKWMHWERKLFGNEMMTAETSNRMALSSLTLTVAEASGWYKPNYTLAENLFWGKNRGCKFVNKKCLFGDPLNATGPEFCSIPKELGCDFESIGSAVCFTKTGAVSNRYWNYFGNNTIAVDPYTDNCPVYTAYGNRICGPGASPKGSSPEYFGTNSACFKSGIHYIKKSSAVQGYCYEYKCSKNEVSGLYNLYVKVDTEVFNCTHLAQAIKTTVPGLKGKLICPDPQSFCEIKMDTCEKTCGAYGTCVAGSCVCPSDRIGPDCLRYTTIENDPKCACSFPAVNSYNGNCVCPGFDCSASQLPTTSQCSACIPNCLSCKNVTNCGRCEDGYDAVDGRCILAKTHENSDSGEAVDSSSKSSDTDENSNEIVAAPPAPVYTSPAAFICKGNQYYDESSKTCLNCTNGCSTCTSAAACTTCSSGYLLHLNKCMACPSNCRQCEFVNNASSTDPISQLNCTECTNDEYILKKVDDITLCVPWSTDIKSLSSSSSVIIAGTIGMVFTLMASGYALWILKAREKIQFIKITTV